MSRLVFATVLGTGLACGLAGGVFFAFSSFVMPGLNRLPAARSIAAMQALNTTAVGPAFMLLFVGATVACVVVGIVAVRAWGEPASPWLLAGSVVYVVGAFGLTVGYHVPLNDTLAAVHPHAADAAARWSDYASGWTAWNHVRAAAGLVAAGLLTIGLAVG